MSQPEPAPDNGVQPSDGGSSSRTNPKPRGSAALPSDGLTTPTAGRDALPRVHPQRRTPAKGVRITLGGPNWVMLTVNTHARERWLAQPSVQRILHDVWLQHATAWLVSDYVLMPDHLHLFCAPQDLKFTIERWMAFWKFQFAKLHPPDVGAFQRVGFHHRLRDGENYAEKWRYVRENPVRAGMVKEPEEWPYFGRVHEIHF